MAAAGSDDELPFSPTTRATAIGLLCGVILVGLSAGQFEFVAEGRWWLLPLPGLVAGGLGALLNRLSLPADGTAETIKRSHRRLISAAVIPLMVLTGIGVVLVGLGIANFESLAGDIWAAGGGSSILIVDALGFILLMLALFVVLIALLIVLAVVGVVGAITTAIAYLAVWRLIGPDGSTESAASSGTPPD